VPVNECTDASELSIAEVHEDDDLDALAALAAQIWNEYFPPIIGQQQVDYMVKRFQSRPALEEQLESGYRYFVARRNGQDIGYAGIVVDDAEGDTQLSKLYLARSARGVGVGRSLLRHVCAIARDAGSVTLWLTVNKYNEQALGFYAAQGFVRTDELVMDIGNGFVMDDYRLELALDSSDT
jgi:ribosomal protein S18 acetylase RimI-like enzyme